MFQDNPHPDKPQPDITRQHNTHSGELHLQHIKIPPCVYQNTADIASNGHISEKYKQNNYIFWTNQTVFMNCITISNMYIHILTVIWQVGNAMYMAKLELMQNDDYFILSSQEIQNGLFITAPTGLIVNEQIWHLRTISSIKSYKIERLVFLTKLAVFVIVDCVLIVYI